MLSVQIIKSSAKEAAYRSMAANADDNQNIKLANIL